jgi:hypothetical protein
MDVRMPGATPQFVAMVSVSTFFSKKLLHLRASLGFRKGHAWNRSITVYAAENPCG